MHFIYNSTISLLKSQPWVIADFSLVDCVTAGKCPSLSELFFFFSLLNMKPEMECPRILGYLRRAAQGTNGRKCH